jgi:hypothetical protein
MATNEHTKPNLNSWHCLNGGTPDMPALAMNGAASVHHMINPRCPAIVDFADGLAREAIDAMMLQGQPPDFEELGARLRQFERVHRITCQRCRDFAGEEV